MLIQLVLFFSFQNIWKTEAGSKISATGDIEKIWQQLAVFCQNQPSDKYQPCRPCDIVLKHAEDLSQWHMQSPISEEMIGEVYRFWTAINQKARPVLFSKLCCSSKGLAEALNFCNPSYTKDTKTSSITVESNPLQKKSLSGSVDPVSINQTRAKSRLRRKRDVTKPASESSHQDYNTTGHKKQSVMEVNRGYAILWSFLVVTTINCIPLFGYLIQRCKNNPEIYNLAIQFFIAMAVGALLGDAMVHIIPETFGREHGHHENHSEPGTDKDSHPHDEHDHGHSHSDTVWKSTGVIAGAFVMYFIEVLFIFLSSMGVPHCHGGHHHHHHDHGHGHGHGHGSKKKDVGSQSTDSPSSESVDKTCEHKDDVRRVEHCLMSHQLHVGSPVSCQAESKALDRKDAKVILPDDVVAEEEGNAQESVFQFAPAPEEVEEATHRIIFKTCHGFKKITNLAFMVIAGDSVHNMIDGFNIGVSFLSGNVIEGITTSAAVLLHEIPHEIGDLAVLMNTGLTYWQAFSMHLVSGLFCYFGAAMGVAVGIVGTQHVDRVKCATAGMFLYICFTGLVPGMLKDVAESRNKLLTLTAHFSGFIIGVSMMYLLILLE